MKAPSPKQPVRYRALHYCKVGERALVETVNHPDYKSVRSLEPAATSVVVAFDPATGVFETQNSVYTPGPFADIKLREDLPAHLKKVLAQKFIQAAPAPQK